MVCPENMNSTRGKRYRLRIETSQNLELKIFQVEGSNLHLNDFQDLLSQSIILKIAFTVRITGICDL